MKNKADLALYGSFKHGWKLFYRDYNRINVEIRELQRQKGETLARLGALLGIYKYLKEKYPSMSLPTINIPPELRFNLGVNTKIGDAVEIVLSERGALTQREIIELLREANVRLSLKHPHIVLANTMKRDKAKRFKKLKDGRITLAKK